MVNCTTSSGDFKACVWNKQEKIEMGKNIGLKGFFVQVMWSEERIRELMSAARLREVNWDKQTPAERCLQICLDEKN